jgi:GTPase SAR1 family protein
MEVELIDGGGASTIPGPKILKLLMVGDYEVGKRSLVSRYTNPANFKPTTNYTIGVEWSSKDIIVDRHPVKAHIVSLSELFV